MQSSKSYGPYPEELDADIYKAYVSESAEVLHFLWAKKLRQKSKDTDAGRLRGLRSSAVFGISQ